MALINYLTRIHFADGVLEDALAEELSQYRTMRPLVIVGDVDMDACARVLDALPPGAVGIRFAPSVDDTSSAEVERARVCFSTMGCDAYIGLGGATAISLARRAAHTGAERRDCDRDFAAAKAGVVQGRTRSIVITIPTTTECVGLIPLFERARDSLCCPRGAATAMVPDLVFCDPTLTLAAGPRATAAAGMDLIAHCIEAYLSTTWNPPADGMALDGLRRATTHLPRAVDQGLNLAARRELLAAAVNAGLASQKGLGAAHALASALDIEIRPPAPHGYFNAALLPAVLAFNAPAVQDRLPDLHQALHCLPHADLMADLTAFGVRIALPQSLASLALTPAMRLRIANRAVEDQSSQTNPRHATVADYMRILEQAS